MKSFLKISALLYLVSVLAFFAGVYVTISKSWPYNEIRELYLFIQGDPAENTTIAQKMQNDLDIHPARQLLDYKPANPGSFSPLKIPGLRARRGNPLLSLSTGAEAGYRLIYGVLDFEENLHGAILLDANGELVHSWQVTERYLDWATSSDLNKFPHGIHVLPDGSIVFVFTRSSSIQRIDACGNPVWAVEGKYHHAVTAEGDNFVWSMQGDPEGVSDFQNRFVKLDVHKGEIVKSFTVEDIVRANPELSIFHIQEMRNSDQLLLDGFHPNDIEPLSADMAPAFPGFSAGDLLISYRNNSLIFVVDADTLKVKWWRAGHWRRQHDPDWQADGTIVLYDNNPPDSNVPPLKNQPPMRYYSKIVSIRPSTFEVETPIDGKAFNFYSDIRGKHQVLPGGNFLVTSANQGRVLEVNRHGDIVFEFVNQYNETEILPVSEAIFLPEDYFDEDAFSKCGGQAAPQ